MWLVFGITRRRNHGAWLVRNIVETRFTVRSSFHVRTCVRVIKPSRVMVFAIWAFARTKMMCNDVRIDCCSILYGARDGCVL